MANQAVDWLHGQATKIISTVVVAVGYIVWSIFKSSLEPPELVAFSLLVFVCLTWLADRFWHLPTQLRVRQWLDGTGFDVKTMPLNGAQFRYVLTDNLQIKTTIVQWKPAGPIEILALGIEPTPTQKAAIRSAPSEAEKTFWRHVKLELLRLGIQYSDLTLDNPGVTIFTRLPLSHELSDVDFLGAVLRIRSTTRYLIESMAEFERLVPKSSPDEAHPVEVADKISPSSAGVETQ